jgi:dTDP-D-glucose 4,6-dehydratase
MGVDYPKTFEQSLEKTVRWYLEHPEWLLDTQSAAQARKLHPPKDIAIGERFRKEVAEAKEG